MDNILCEIQGRKRIVLWPPEEVNHLYVSGSSSQVIDIDHPNYKLYPKFSKSKRSRRECILGPGEFLFIPSLWFHNVISLEPCVAINIFWRHLEADQYEKKDLYGNKDLVLATKAMKEADQVISTLQSLPEYYRPFYAKKIIETMKSSFKL
jgi:hypothetical protein